MEVTDYSITKTDEDGTRDERSLVEYSEEERQKARVDSNNAGLLFNVEFLVVPTWLLHAGLTAQEILIYSFISYFCGKTGKFYFSNEQMAEMFELDPSNVSKILKKLKEKGFIESKVKVRAGGGTIRFVQIMQNGKGEIATSGRVKTPKPYNEYKDNKYKDNYATRASREFSAGPELGSLPALAKRKTTPAQKEKVAPAIPSLEEVKAYRAGRRYSPINPQEFFDWYSTAGWQDRDGKPIKNWKLKFITWENARFKDDTSLRHVNEDDKTYYKRIGLNYIDPSDHPATVQETDPVMAYGADLTLDDLNAL